MSDVRPDPLSVAPGVHAKANAPYSRWVHIVRRVRDGGSVDWYCGNGTTSPPRPVADHVAPMCPNCSYYYTRKIENRLRREETRIAAAPAFDPYREQREETMRRLAKELPFDEDVLLAMKGFDEDIDNRDSPSPQDRSMK